jgi:adenylate cyclase
MLPQSGRIRRVATVRPYGLASAVEISELLPPAQEDLELSDQKLRDYEAALEAFVAGRWHQTLDLLHRVPAEDLVKDFLTVFIAQHHRTPPANWDGVVVLESK